MTLPLFVPRRIGALDSAAVAYFTAAGITDSTQKRAYNTLVLRLREYGIYNKLFALYPFLGGTAASHKWNAISPLDTNGAFRLTFTGGVTHSSTGVAFNGTTGFANTFFVPSTSGFTSTSGSFGVYSRTNALGGYDFASSIAGGSNSTAVLSRYGAGLQHASFGGNFGTNANSDSRGFFTTNRNGAVSTEGYAYGSYRAKVDIAVTLPAFAMYIGAENRAGTAGEFSAREYALAYISSGLTLLEQFQLYKAVQQFQTDLGRQVNGPYELWLAKANTYGTVTTKEQAAVSQLFKTLTHYNLVPYLYSLYLLGGDDAGFSTTANRLNKRGINAVNPSSVATWPVSAGITLYSQEMTTSGLDYGQASALVGSYTGYVKSNAGLSWGLSLAALYANNAGGWGTPPVNLFTSPTSVLDFWGNPPNGPGASLGIGQFTSVSTSTIGTGIKLYVNGAFSANGVNGTAIPDSTTQPMYLLWNQPSGGAGHTGRTYYQADHQALSATQVANFHAAMSAYYAAMA